MITGRRRLQKPTIAESLAAILRDEPPGLRASGHLIPEELEAIVTTCLKKNPDYRHASTSILLESLRALTTAGFANVVVRPLRSAGGGFRWGYLRLPAAVVAVLAVLGLFWMTTGRSWLSTRKPAEAKHICDPAVQKIGDDPAQQGVLRRTRGNAGEQAHSDGAIPPVAVGCATSEVVGQEVTSAADASRKLGVTW